MDGIIILGIANIDCLQKNNFFFIVICIGEDCAHIIP